MSIDQNQDSNKTSGGDSEKSQISPQKLNNSKEKNKKIIFLKTIDGAFPFSS